MSWTIDQFLQRLRPHLPDPARNRTLPRPTFSPQESARDKIALAVSSMEHHMTDEGWQLMLAFRSEGYALWGGGCENDCVDVREILARTNAGTVLVQDKREWDVKDTDFRDQGARFRGIQLFKAHPESFKLTVLKDAHARPDYHAQSAAEMDCHAWVVYYHERIVHALAPYTRPEHLIRTYHTVNKDDVPPFARSRSERCLLSGAISNAYPLRKRLAYEVMRGTLGCMDYLPHPGYHRKRSQTPEYLQILNRYMVSVCTSSIYGYALRKIVESTAAGCVVITDLPSDDVMPYIDGNLIRVDPEIPTWRLRELVNETCANYDPERQRHFAQLAAQHYDYRAEGRRLCRIIKDLRDNYDNADHHTTGGLR
jgi:hypothetical protein